MFYVYILFSEKLNKYYIGFTADVKVRLNNYHNAGRVTFTSKGTPWVLKYTEEFQTELEAMRREKQINTAYKYSIVHSSHER